MIRPDWSTTSRTGYEYQPLPERIREAIAILCSMFAVGLLIASILIVAQFFKL